MTDVKPDKHGWMPIENAPRDGKEKILASPNPEGAGYMVVVGVNSNLSTTGWRGLFLAYGVFKTFDWYKGDLNATHWQPLPEPPEGQ